MRSLSRRHLFGIERPPHRATKALTFYIHWLCSEECGLQRKRGPGNREDRAGLRRQPSTPLRGTDLYSLVPCALLYYGRLAHVRRSHARRSSWSRCGKSWNRRTRPSKGSRECLQISRFVPLFGGTTAVERDAHHPFRPTVCSLQVIRNYNGKMLNDIKPRIAKWHPNQSLGDIFLQVVRASPPMTRHRPRFRPLCQCSHSTPPR